MFQSVLTWFQYYSVYCEVRRPQFPQRICRCRLITFAIFFPGFTASNPLRPYTCRKSSRPQNNWRESPLGLNEVSRAFQNHLYQLSVACLCSNSPTSLDKDRKVNLIRLNLDYNSLLLYQLGFHSLPFPSLPFITTIIVFYSQQRRGVYGIVWRPLPWLWFPVN